MLRTLRAGLGILLVVGMTLSDAPGVPPLTAATEAIPDLVVAPLSDFQIQWVNGRRLLRFTAMMVNKGAGHFELRGSRPNTSSPMVMKQVIYTTTNRSQPISRQVTTGAVAKYAGDGHNHWHVQEMMRYDMWGTTGKTTMRGAKVGFCFLDSDPYRLSLPGAPASRYYGASGCSTDPNALSNRMGISIGWGDKYTWNLAWQWVDITGLPSGTYTVRAKVDPYGFFVEQAETNQCAWATVSFTGSSNAVTLGSKGTTCANDWSNSPFAGDIAWMFDTGITIGCAPDLFCPNAAVLRGEMASFLARGFGLPASSADYFTDDETSPHEAAINSIAAAGITTGCTATRYCPAAAVTRAQMASFLDRALDLPATTTDYFTDDEGSIHEDAINRIAAAGITLGCGATTYCPNRTVMRGEMAAFMHRALT